MFATLSAAWRRAAPSAPFPALLTIGAVSFVITLLVALSIPRTGPGELKLTTGDAGDATSALLGDPLEDEVPDGIVAGGGGVAAGLPAVAPVDGPRTPYGLSGNTGGLTSSGIPARAHQAYVAAAANVVAADPSCRISWPVIAGIGRVESNHGRFGGSGIRADGLIVPAILGIRLDGTRAGTATIRDSDGGSYDGDAVYDRAVGPMQFLPGTWRGYGADADGDGVANPQDIDDAALGTARYLCAGNATFATREGAWSAVYRYNHSDSYVSLVLSLADSYGSGRPVEFTEAPPGVVRPVGESATAPGAPPAIPAPAPVPGTPGRPGTPAGTPAPSPTGTPAKPGTPTRPPLEDDGYSPAPTYTPPLPVPGKGIDPTPRPTRPPATTPPPTTEPTPDPTTPAPEPTTEPTPEPTTEPTPEPTPESTPESTPLAGNVSPAP